eukprot:3580600-Rhodomonas_salina.4
MDSDRYWTLSLSLGPYASPYTIYYCLQRAIPISLCSRYTMSGSHRTAPIPAAEQDHTTGNEVQDQATEQNNATRQAVEFDATALIKDSGPSFNDQKQPHVSDDEHDPVWMADGAQPMQTRSLSPAQHPLKNEPHASAQSFGSSVYYEPGQSGSETSCADNAELRFGDGVWGLGSRDEG